MPTTFRAWDDYFIPGTTVLRNRLGATTAQDLAVREEFAASLRLAELAEDPVQGRFDYDHMKEIHRRIFQDVYEWAGHERVGPDARMTKDGPDVVHYAVGDPAAPTVAYGYYPGPQVAAAAEAEYRALAAANFLVGLPRTEFVEQLAERWAELNVVHSFREGNSRAQFVFFHQLAEHAGYRLDTKTFQVGEPLRDRFVAARFYSQATGRSDRLAEVISEAITPLPQQLPARTTSYPMTITEALRTSSFAAHEQPRPRPSTGVPAPRPDRSPGRD